MNPQTILIVGLVKYNTLLHLVFFTMTIGCLCGIEYLAA